MIARIWRGYTNHENENAYETLLRHEIFTGIANRNIEGYKKIQLLRRNINDEVEFITIMWFESIEAIKIFAGEDYEKAVVPDKAKTLLKRFDKISQHYEVVSNEEQPIKK
jgi:heme-degrading monooxygenase HmoA